MLFDKEKIRTYFSLGLKNKTSFFTHKEREYIFSLPLNTTFQGKLYCILHNLKTIPLCNTCHKNEVSFKNKDEGFKRVCNDYCYKNGEYLNTGKTLKQLDTIENHKNITLLKKEAITKNG